MAKSGLSSNLPSKLTETQVFCLDAMSLSASRRLNPISFGHLPSYFESLRARAAQDCGRQMCVNILRRRLGGDIERESCQAHVADEEFDSSIYPRGPTAQQMQFLSSYAS